MHTTFLLYFGSELWKTGEFQIYLRKWCNLTCQSFNQFHYFFSVANKQAKKLLTAAALCRFN